VIPPADAPQFKFRNSLKKIATVSAFSVGGCCSLLWSCAVYCSLLQSVAVWRSLKNIVAVSESVTVSALPTFLVYTNIHARTQMHTYARTRAHTHVRTHTHTHIQMHSHIITITHTYTHSNHTSCVCVCLPVSMSVSVSACVWVYQCLCRLDWWRCLLQCLSGSAPVSDRVKVKYTDRQRERESLYACVTLYVHIRASTCASVFLCVCVRMRVCVYVCVHTWTHIHNYILLHTHIHFAVLDESGAALISLWYRYIHW